MSVQRSLERIRARRATPARQRSGERGIAILITLLLVLGVGIGLVTAGVARTVPLQLRAENKALSAMAEAKQALTGRAVGDDDRPGSLPCPDSDNDGIADIIPLASVTGDCPSYIGRLPWKTLGLSDLRDEHGERLWYALSPKYRDHLIAQPINSDTPGKGPPDLLVFANTKATTLAPKAVAVIFSPGAPVRGQQRDATAALCAVTGTTIPNDRCVSNYLESAGGVDNASATGPYIAAQKSGAFNDRLAVLTPADLMPLVEVRVAGELRRALINYRLESDCECFPWAGNALGVSQPGVSRGRFPSAQALPENWGEDDISRLPPWVDANRWGDVVYYSAAQTAVERPPRGAPCRDCTSPTLIVDGTGGYTALFFMPGPATSERTVGVWPQYIDDAANNDAADDIYITPTSTALARDRLMLMPSRSPLQCAANSRMLFENAPCKLRRIVAGRRRSSIKPECLYAVENLQICSCRLSADKLLEKPCSKKIKKAECKAAVSDLKQCNF